MTSNLRLLTWNVFWCLGYPHSKPNHAWMAFKYLKKNPNKDIAVKIADVIKSLDPDFVGLQEIDGGSKRINGHNQAEYISDIAGFSRYIYATERSHLNYLNDGNALLSKTDSLKPCVDILPYAFERRNYTRADISLNGSTVSIYATHLGALKLNSPVRAVQFMYLCEAVNKDRNPAIILGDFNCCPDDPEFSHLIGQTSLCPIIKNPTYPSYDPKYCFDNILVTKHFDILEAKVLDVKLSDHLPVFAQVALRT